jgi:hypothetical protein
MFIRDPDFLPSRIKLQKRVEGKNFTYLSSQKYGFGIRDPRYGKVLSRIQDPEPGVKKAPDPDVLDLACCQATGEMLCYV